MELIRFLFVLSILISLALPSGQSSPKGNTGPSGQSSPKGNTGPSGQSSPKGNTGPSGKSSPKGNPGPSGKSSPKGNTGPSGKSSSKGNTGPSGQLPITINCDKNGDMRLNSSEEILVLSPSACTKNSTSDKTKAVFTNCLNKTVTVMLLKKAGNESITDTEYSVICPSNVHSGETFSVTGQLLKVSTMKPVTESGSVNPVHFEMSFTKNGKAVNTAGYVTLGDVLIMKISTRGLNRAGWKLIPNTCTAYPENAKNQHKLDLINSQNCPTDDADGLISSFKWSPKTNLELNSKVKVFEFKDGDKIEKTLVFECNITICSNSDKSHGNCKSNVTNDATNCHNKKLQVRRRRDTELLKGKPDSAATHTVTGVLRIHNAVVNEVMSGSVKLEMSVNLICLVHLCLALLYMKDQN